MTIASMVSESSFSFFASSDSKSAALPSLDMLAVEEMNESSVVIEVVAVVVVLSLLRFELILLVDVASNFAGEFLTKFVIFCKNEEPAESGLTVVIEEISVVVVNFSSTSLKDDDGLDDEDNITGDSVEETSSSIKDMESFVEEVAETMMNKEATMCRETRRRIKRDMLTGLRKYKQVKREE